MSKSSTKAPLTLARRLVIRLSSLGDVVLASAALGAPEAADGVDWVVAAEFAPLLQGHPKVRKVIPFDRSSGLGGWVALSRTLWAHDYIEVFDLHKSLRTGVTRFLFLFWSLTSGRSPARWHTVSKQRIAFYGHCLFKGLWPISWRPTPWRRRFARTLGGEGGETPNLCHLVNPMAIQVLGGSRRFLCLMPGAKWPGKRWPVERFVEVARESGLFPVVLGTASDVESSELVRRLTALGVEHFSGVGQWSLPQVASVLASSRGLVSCDTGLAHLAESVGVPVWTVFGPTSPSLGFGPWREESRAIGSPLKCRPCGKDGEWCIRPFRRHRCREEVGASEVLQVLRASLDATGGRKQ